MCDRYSCGVQRTQRDAAIEACRELITQRFPDDAQEGAAAMLLGDGTVATGTAPEVLNPAVESCHELEPFCAAYRLGQPVLASVCLHRAAPDRFVVLSPCGVCREHLAIHGPEVQVAVADRNDPTKVVWKSLRQLSPDFWRSALTEDAASVWR
jgi:cytidine deaminase